MKNHSFRQQRGFTLVELLIVIAIIMVLAALGFAGVQSALKKARTVQTLNMVTNTSQAIQNFFDEYGSLPTANATPTPISTNTPEGLNVLRVLLAQEGTSTGSTILNTKGVRYLDVKQAKARKAGVVYDTAGTNVTGMFDAWGDPLWIAFDEDYNDEIANPIPSTPTDPTIIRGMKAIVYSYGADRVEKTKDDVRSW
jgi:prepilin-type N-terminal cleavage/methylation domain-containing protein